MKEFLIAFIVLFIVIVFIPLASALIMGNTIDNNAQGSPEVIEEYTGQGGE